LSTAYLQVADLSEVAVGTIKKVVLQGKEILLANIDGEVYAVDAVCTHFGGDLSLGTLDANVITCPRHQAKFDLTTGRNLSPPKVGPYNPKINDLTAYPVKIENQKILIKTI